MTFAEAKVKCKNFGINWHLIWLTNMVKQQRVAKYVKEFLQDKPMPNWWYNYVMTGGVVVSRPPNGYWMWENYRTTIIADSQLLEGEKNNLAELFVVIDQRTGMLMNIREPQTEKQAGLYGICEKIVPKTKSNHFRIMRINGQDMRSLIGDTIVELNGIMMENIEVSPEYIDGEKFHHPHAFKYVDLI
ncbi:hypothetical protein SNEBB_006483 [Seison nebaliae]|nr:hypothetical protein SNEBB_006483 [Seison nebaliae]